MTEFISLSDARQAMKGNFVGTVMAISDLKAGSKDGKDWTNKRITIEDTTARITLTAWNDEIKLFEHGKTYEFESCWFQLYKEDVNLSISKFGKVRLAQMPAEPKQTTMPPPAPNPSQVLDHTMMERKEETNKLPQPSEALIHFVNQEDVLILQINEIVRNNAKDMGIPNNDPFVGLRVKEIYRESKKLNLKKASDVI